MLAVKLFRFLFLFHFLFSYSIIAQNSTFQWAYELEAFAKGIAMDTNGNVLRTGIFSGTIDLASGPSIQNITAEGESDFYVEKLDTNGNLLWVKSIGGVGHDISQSIATDLEGNVYISGVYTDTVDFNPGAGVFNMTAGDATYIFILKLNSNGDFVWAKTNQTGNSGSCNSIIVDSVGYIYLTGSFAGVNDFDPGPNVRNIMSQGFSSIFIQKLDPDGNLVYAKSIGGEGTDAGASIKADENGNAYIGGHFQFTADFDTDEDTLNLTVSGDSDAFIVKLDDMGGFLWAKQLDTKFWLVESCQLDLDDNGNIYATGVFNDVMDANPDSGVFNLTSIGNEDVFIIKLNNDGEFIWAKQIGGGGDIHSGSIQVMSNGEIYSSGTFSGPIDFDPGNGEYILNAEINYDSYLEKLDSNGEFIWLKQCESLDSGTVKARYFVANDEGHMYTAGILREKADLDPGMGSYIINDSSYFGISYLQKLRPCQLIQSIDEVSACNAYTWIDGVTYTDNNNTAIYNYIGGSVNGCDSIVLLNLTINHTNGSTTNNIGSTIIANNNFASYVWLDCNNNFEPIPGETSDSYTSFSGGSYAVELTENGCVDTSACVTIASVGLIENTFSDAFTIFPNPTKGQFSIKFEKEQPFISVNIYSLLGQEINSFSFEYQSEAFLNIEGESGLYVIELQSINDEKAYIRMVKE